MATLQAAKAATGATVNGPQNERWQRLVRIATPLIAIWQRFKGAPAKAEAFPIEQACADLRTPDREKLQRLLYSAFGAPTPAEMEVLRDSADAMSDEELVRLLNRYGGAVLILHQEWTRRGNEQHRRLKEVARQAAVAASLKRDLTARKGRRGRS